MPWFKKPSTRARAATTESPRQSDLPQTGRRQTVAPGTSDTVQFGAPYVAPASGSAPPQGITHWSPVVGGFGSAATGVTTSAALPPRLTHKPLDTAGAIAAIAQTDAALAGEIADTLTSKRKASPDQAKELCARLVEKIPAEGFATACTQLIVGGHLGTHAFGAANSLIWTCVHGAQWQLESAFATMTLVSHVRLDWLAVEDACRLACAYERETPNLLDWLAGLAERGMLDDSPALIAQSLLKGSESDEYPKILGRILKERWLGDGTKALATQIWEGNMDPTGLDLRLVGSNELSDPHMRNFQDQPYPYVGYLLEAFAVARSGALDDQTAEALRKVFKEYERRALAFNRYSLRDETAFDMSTPEFTATLSRHGISNQELARDFPQVWKACCEAPAARRRAIQDQVLKSLLSANEFKLADDFLFYECRKQRPDLEAMLVAALQAYDEPAGMPGAQSSAELLQHILERQRYHRLM